MVLLVVGDKNVITADYKTWGGKRVIGRRRCNNIALKPVYMKYEFLNSDLDYASRPPTGKKNNW